MQSGLVLYLQAILHDPLYRHLNWNLLEWSISQSRTVSKILWVIYDHARLVTLPAHSKMRQWLCWCSLVKNRILDTFSNLFRTRLHHPNIKTVMEKRNYGNMFTYLFETCFKNLLFQNFLNHFQNCQSFSQLIISQHTEIIDRFCDFSIGLHIYLLN